LRFKIDWASPIVGRKLPFWLCFTLYLRGICQLKSPHPLEFAIQGKKMPMPGGESGGWGGRWAQLELTDALGHYLYRSEFCIGSLPLRRIGVPLRIRRSQQVLSVTPPLLNGVGRGCLSQLWQLVAWRTQRAACFGCLLRTNCYRRGRLFALMFMAIIATRYLLLSPLCNLGLSICAPLALPCGCFVRRIGLRRETLLLSLRSLLPAIVTRALLA